jgi:hypothetical protein
MVHEGMIMNSRKGTIVHIDIWSVLELSTVGEVRNLSDLGAGQF